MNILIISQMGLESRTGVRTYYASLRDSFTAEKHQVTVLTPQHAPFWVQFFLKVYRKTSLLLPTDYNKLYVSEVFFFVAIHYAVKKAFRRQKWDIIHGQEAASTYAAQLATKGTIPVVTTCHYNDSPIVESELMYKLNKKQLAKVEQWFKSVFKKNDNYIFVSNYVYEKSAFLFNKQIFRKTIPNGVVFSKLGSKNISIEPFVISNVGTIEERKNQILLIDAASHLAKLNFNFKIWFFGEGHKRAEWEKITQQRGLADHIVFWGFKKDRLEILKKSNLYVHTATNESFGLAITEAFSIGLPVLALNTGGVKEQFPASGTGLLPADISPEKLAETIISYANPQLLEQMQAEQYENAQRLTVSNMAKETMAFYNEVLLRPLVTNKISA